MRNRPPRVPPPRKKKAPRFRVELFKSGMAACVVWPSGSWNKPFTTEKRGDDKGPGIAPVPRQAVRTRTKPVCGGPGVVPCTMRIGLPHKKAKHVHCSDTARTHFIGAFGAGQTGNPVGARSSLERAVKPNCGGRCQGIISIGTFPSGHFLPAMIVEAAGEAVVTQRWPPGDATSIPSWLKRLS